MMDWKTYEDVVKNIYETLGQVSGVKIIGYGNTCKIRGKSDIEHQIDVLTSHTDGIHTYLTAVECKYWDQKVDKAIVMKIDSIVKDCNFNKGVIVSKNGFTKDTIKYAKAVNVGLVVLREPTDEDWKGRIKTIVLQIHTSCPHVTRYENMTVEVYKNITGMIATEKYVYLLPDGRKKTVNDFLGEFEQKLLKENSQDEFTDEIKFSYPILMQNVSGDNIAKVIGIKLSGHIDTTTSENIINGEDNVWLIMKSIFEHKTLIVSKEGEIREVS